MALELATDLFEEGNWPACRRECLRALVEKLADENARLLEAVCRLRLGPADDSVQEVLAGLASTAESADVRAMAAYELGRIEWARARCGREGDRKFDQPTPPIPSHLRQGFGGQAKEGMPVSSSPPPACLAEAFGRRREGWRSRGGCRETRAASIQDDAQRAYAHLRQAFLETTSQDLFARAGCSLDLLRHEVPTIGKHDPAVFQSLETSRPLWTREVRQECALPREPGTPLAAKPAQWITGFYRNLVRPALGTRCSLQPSCSHYFEEAAHEHGLLAFPIMADRLVREPDVVAAAENPVRVGEQTRFADPLSDHDEWMRK